MKDDDAAAFAAVHPDRNDPSGPTLEILDILDQLGTEVGFRAPTAKAALERILLAIRLNRRRA